MSSQAFLLTSPTLDDCPSRFWPDESSRVQSADVVPLGSFPSRKWTYELGFESHSLRPVTEQLGLLYSILHFSVLVTQFTDIFTFKFIKCLFRFANPLKYLTLTLWGIQGFPWLQFPLRMAKGSPPRLLVGKLTSSSLILHFDRSHGPVTIYLLSYILQFGH